MSSVRSFDWKRAICALALALLVFPFAAPARAAETEMLEIVSTGVHVFSVEVMRTPDERARG